jgi:hypothetical protein
MDSREAQRRAGVLEFSVGSVLAFAKAAREKIFKHPLFYFQEKLI